MAKNFGVGGWLLVLVVFSFVGAFFSVLMWSGVTPYSLSVFFLKANEVGLNSNGTVFLDSEVDGVLTKLYDSTDLEWVFCVYGERVDGGVLVDNLRETKILERDKESVVYEPCRNNGRLLGTVHNHPIPDSPLYVQSCGLSRADVFSFANERDVLAGVMCGTRGGRGVYGWYDKDSLDLSYDYEVL